MREKYTKLSYKEENGGEWWTCGCGGKPKEKAVGLPTNTVPLLIKKQGFLIGPVTKIKYYIAPNFVSIDIDKEDAEAFKLDKTITIQEIKPPYKSLWARETRM